MNKRSYLIGAVALCLPAVVAAQSMPLLTTEELRAELFGIHIHGYAQFSDLLFDECIDPEGLTVYRTRTAEEATPYSEQGQMRINDLAQACFSYPPDTDPDPACFRVFRNGGSYVFQSISTPDRFIVTDIKRDVLDCPNPGDLLS